MSTVDVVLTIAVVLLSGQCWSLQRRLEWLRRTTSDMFQTVYRDMGKGA